MAPILLVVTNKTQLMAAVNCMEAGDRYFITIPYNPLAMRIDFREKDDKYVQQRLRQMRGNIRRSPAKAFKGNQ